MTEPTISELVNAQPERIRAYIHALEANADPAGTVQENTLMRDLLAQANAHIAGLNQQLGVAKRELESADQRANATQLKGMRLALAGDRLRELVMEGVPSERECSCHISPPCGDCVDYGGQREAADEWDEAVKPFNGDAS